MRALGLLGPQEWRPFQIRSKPSIRGEDIVDAPELFDERFLGGVLRHVLRRQLRRRVKHTAVTSGARHRRRCAFSSHLRAHEVQLAARAVNDAAQHAPRVGRRRRAHNCGCADAGHLSHRSPPRSRGAAAAPRRCRRPHPVVPLWVCAAASAHSRNSKRCVGMRQQRSGAADAAEDHTWEARSGP